MSLRSIWAISDGAAGNRRQALALAECLADAGGALVRELDLRARAPWSWLAPRRLPALALAWDARARTHLAPPRPDLAIGCGRQAALVTRWLRRDGTRSVQILDPRIATRHWDVVIAPRHDGLHGANVLTTLGALHGVDARWLADARAAWHELARLPQPRIGVLLGGPRRGVPLDAPWRADLRATLRALLQQGGSVLIVASRRTPPDLVERIAAGLPEAQQRLWRGAADGPNPYPGVLAWSDRLLVSPDSVNMLSEAAATGLPLHSVVHGALPPKLAQFHAALRAGGWLLPSGAPATAAPLGETAAIAAQLRARLHL